MSSSSPPDSPAGAPSSGSNSDDSLPDRLSVLTDAAIAVLNTADTQGWSHAGAADALDVIDILIARILDDMQAPMS